MSSEPDNIVEKLQAFDDKHKAFINLIVKPVGSLLIFLAIGYYTMWMSANYVKQDKFNIYIEKQDQIIESNFENTRNQLQTIIQNQTSFTEQLKAYNQQISSYQKNVDALSDRITFLERNFYKMRDSSTNNY